MFAASALHFTGKAILLAQIVTGGAVFYTHRHAANDFCTALAGFVAWTQ